MAKKIIACGSFLRGDDAVALIVAEKLKEEFPIIIAELTPENFIERDDEILLIDAIVSKQDKIGDVKVLDFGDFVKFKEHTHSLLGISAKIAKKIKVAGIVIENNSFGIGLSAEIRRKLPEIEKKLKFILKEFLDFNE